MDAPEANVAAADRSFRLGDFLRNQLRNIAPFITLLFLVLFFSIASPAFAIQYSPRFNDAVSAEIEVMKISL